MIKVKNAWYLNELPTHIVAELDNNSLVMFQQTPFRKLRSNEFNQYKGYNPSQCKGYELNDYMYRFYGFEKVN